MIHYLSSNKAIQLSIFIVSCLVISLYCVVYLFSLGGLLSSLNNNDNVYSQDLNLKEIKSYSINSTDNTVSIVLKDDSELKDLVLSLVYVPSLTGTDLEYYSEDGSSLLVGISNKFWISYLVSSGYLYVLFYSLLFSISILYFRKRAYIFFKKNICVILSWTFFGISGVVFICTYVLLS